VRGDFFLNLVELRSEIFGRRKKKERLGNSWGAEHRIYWILEVAPRVFIGGKENRETRGEKKGRSIEA